MRYRGLFILLPLVVLVAACTTKVTNVQTGRDFDPSVLDGGVVALGGFVASTRLLDDYPVGPDAPPIGDLLAQTEAWAPVLYGAFLAEAPQMNIWPWPTVAAAVTDSTLADGLTVFARGGLLRPDQLDPVARELPGARYLALVRLDGNEVSLHESAGSVTRNQRDHDGRQLHANEGAANITTRRRLTVTLEIYDLQTGLSLWGGTIRHDAKELYNPEDARTDAPDSLRTGDPYIRVTGTSQQGPPFMGVLEAACAAAVKRMQYGDDGS